MYLHGLGERFLFEGTFKPFIHNQLNANGLELALCEDGRGQPSDFDVRQIKLEVQRR